MARASQPERLRVELWFRPDPSPERWRRVLAAVGAWEPRVAPREVERSSDADAPSRAEPWSEARLDELCRRCAIAEPLAWTLLGDEGAVQVAREPLQLKRSE